MFHRELGSADVFDMSLFCTQNGDSVCASQLGIGQGRGHMPLEVDLSSHWGKGSRPLVEPPCYWLHVFFLMDCV